MSRRNRANLAGIISAWAGALAIIQNQDVVLTFVLVFLAVLFSVFFIIHD